jgi:hypothetical protein
VTLIAVGVFLTAATIYLRRRRLVVDEPPVDDEAVEELPVGVAGT